MYVSENMSKKRAGTSHENVYNYTAGMLISHFER